MLDGTIYRLRARAQWTHLPAEFGPDTTVHRWHQRFVADGMFERLWAILIEACAELAGVSWHWQVTDTFLGKAQHGGFRRPEPDRPGEGGTKRELLTD